MGRVIGHGAFGVVRIAREKEGGRLVAMKQVSAPTPTPTGGLLSYVLVARLVTMSSARLDKRHS
jgi:serine/threonine protein kinase